jgi:hypothetical protein
MLDLYLLERCSNLSQGIVSCQATIEICDCAYKAFIG